MTGSTVSAVAMAAAWVALEAVGALAAIGVRIPTGAAIACATVAAPLALAAAARTLSSAWLGPPIVAFSAADAVLCAPADAASVRAAAQLRGTMGGAGHLHRERLAFPVAAWLGALAAGLEGIAAPSFVGAWPAALAACAALAAWLLPARPYWYREVMGGRVVVSPPAAATVLASRGGRSRPAGSAVEPDPGG